jgi:hypothetical protein
MKKVNNIQAQAAIIIGQVGRFLLIRDWYVYLIKIKFKNPESKIQDFFLHTLECISSSWYLVERLIGYMWVRIPSFQQKKNNKWIIKLYVNFVIKNIL